MYPTKISRFTDLQKNPILINILEFYIRENWMVHADSRDLGFLFDNIIGLTACETLWMVPALTLETWLLTNLQSGWPEMKKGLNRMHYEPKGPWALSLTLEAVTHCIQALAKPVLHQKSCSAKWKKPRNIQR